MLKIMVVLITGVLFGLSGCDQFSKHATESIATDRYQMAISNDGKVYRLDKKSGEMVVIEDGACKRIGSSGVR